MRSSAPTRNPRPSGIPLYLVRVGDDHPKACTGRRLLARGLAVAPPSGRDRRALPILLDPHAGLPLAPCDRDRALAGGLLAVDCSWNGLYARGRFPAGSVPRAVGRRLPWLLAANPQHFGRLSELNTVEALGAALYLLEEPERATELLRGFPGGGSWVALNERYLDAYRAAGDAEGIRAAEHRLFGPAARNEAQPGAGGQP